jgi:hypothetical protein
MGVEHGGNCRRRGRAVKTPYKIAFWQINCRVLQLTQSCLSHNRFEFQNTPRGVVDAVKLAKLGPLLDLINGHHRSRNGVIRPSKRRMLVPHLHDGPARSQSFQ